MATRNSTPTSPLARIYFPAETAKLGGISTFRGTKEGFIRRVKSKGDVSTNNPGEKNNFVFLFSRAIHPRPGPA